MLAALIRRKTDSDKKRDAFEKFKNEKIKAVTLNLILYELGHVLGLGHNFNNTESSIMNYSDTTKLSDYDRDALRHRVRGESPPEHTWSPILVPPKNSEFTGS